MSSSSFIYLMHCIAVKSDSLYNYTYIKTRMTNLKPRSSSTEYTMKKSPDWLRLLQIGLGAISIILSIIVLTFPGFAVYTIILMLSVVLVMVGIERIAIGIAAPPFATKKSSRIANIGLGILALIFGSIVISYPIHTTEFLILLGALGLLFNGVARITQGAINKHISRWSRGFLVGVGVLSLAVSALVMAHPIGIGVPLLAITISIALLITGVQMVALGIGGRPLKQYSESQVRDMK